MRKLSAPALVLDVFDLKERDRIVTFLTAKWGKKRGVARGARAKYSRFAGQLQPLAKVAVGWFEKDKSDLVRIDSVELLRPAARLQTDLEGILLGGYLAGHMMEMAQENEASEPLFRLLDSTVEALIAGVDRELAARYYEVWMLRLAGVFPPPRTCPLCNRDLEAGATLDAEEGMMVCRPCGSKSAGKRSAVSPAVITFLRRTSGENLASMAAQATASPVLGEVEALAGRVRRHFLQHELRSYRVMKQTLAGLPPMAS